MADLTGLPQELQTIIQRGITRSDTLSNQLSNGSMSLDEWVQEMGRLIASTHQTAIMAGTDTSMSNEMLALATQAVTVQLSFLDNFRQDIETNGFLNRYSTRAQQYVSSSKQSYWNGSVIEQAGQVLPLPAMPAEGTQCLSNCKCGWRIVVVNRGNNDFDAFWERHVEDSCQTCLEREAQWSPVRIRGGVLQ